MNKHIVWQENGQTHTALWRSEHTVTPPKYITTISGDIKADTAYRLACEGHGILWRGSYPNALALLQALARRIERGANAKPSRSASKRATAASPAERFHRYRMAQIQRARILGRLILPFEANHHLTLARAPDVRKACDLAFGQANAPYLMSLRDLQGAIGAWQWQRKGISIEALNERIHPHYGVFAPTRQEYIALLSLPPLPSTQLAFDIGTGTGVLAAVLAHRGIAKVVATETSPRALACARDNLSRLGLIERIEVCQTDLFPSGRAPLIVCNPPWLPGKASSTLEQAVYDEDGRMLEGFVGGLSAHLTPQGEAWLIMSDLAEHLGLRSSEALAKLFAQAGLRVVGCHQTKPQHPRAYDPHDQLFAARAAETICLWQLALPSSTVTLATY